MKIIAWIMLIFSLLAIFGLLLNLSTTFGCIGGIIYGLLSTVMAFYIIKKL